MKCFIISDVHSFYHPMMNALSKKGFNKNNPDHVLISLGDLLDRGPDSLKCLEFINSLKRKILIRGNHEDLLEIAIRRGYFKSMDYHNGTTNTAIQLSGKDAKTSTDEEILHCLIDNKLWLTYKEGLIDYAETKKFVFTHGWIPYGPNWRDGNWDMARWKNGMECWKLGENFSNKTVVCGHWHTSWGHCYLHNNGSEFECNYESDLKPNFKPFIDKKIIAIDSCVAYSGFLNCITRTIDNEELKKYLEG